MGPTAPGRPRRVAVIGSGVAGLVAAHVAARSAHVTLFEADDRLGGHADTHVVDDPVAGPLAIDTGFIVHNERTYPTLLRLFGELGVATQESEMSLSVSDDATGLEYAGALGARGLFPVAGNLARPAYLRMLGEIPRFHRRARRLVSTGSTVEGGGDAQTTLREFLAAGGFSAYFARHFMEPLVAAVWSCDPDLALDYPARYLFTFLDHHGMLGVFGSPRWRTVTGGSHEYVHRVAAGLQEVRLDTLVTTVLETADGVEVTDGNGAVTSYDAAVVATHPAQALAMLAEPTPAQREVLAALPYSRNVALLHTDASLLPRAEPARASWNFRRPRTELAKSETQAGMLRRLGSDPSSRGADRDVSKPSPRTERGQVVVTYDLTRLQRLATATRYLVTLGGDGLVDPATVLARMEYEHPLYTPASVAAQRRLPEVHTDRVAFAGAYHGWGFHEDGARSGLAAVERLGLSWDDRAVVEEAHPVVESPGPLPAARSGRKIWGYSDQVRRPAEGLSLETPAPTQGSNHGGHRPAIPAGVSRPVADAPRTSPTGSLYATTIRHTRRTPFRRTFAHRSHTWVVDLDALPDHGRRGRLLGRFEARDHLGDPAGTIRGNVEAFLDAHGIDLGGGRILMAAHPRALGHCFNPITVFWCHDAAGTQVAVVVEVHNTYGDRHAYLVHPDEQGRASTPKRLYVSPFHGTDGTYDLAVPRPGRRLRVAVTLRTDGSTGGEVFSASLDGRRVTARPWRAVPASLRGSLLIRAHGLRLWLRGLPVRPRPDHHQEGVSR